MKVFYQGKEIEIEEATDEEISLDYANPKSKNDLEETLAITEIDIQSIDDGDENE